MKNIHNIFLSTAFDLVSYNMLSATVRRERKAKGMAMDLTFNVVYAVNIVEVVFDNFTSDSMAYLYRL